MPGYPVHLHLLFVEEHVVAYLQHGNGSVEVGADEVCEVELVVRAAHYHRTSLREARNRLSGDVVVCKHAAAVRITLECIVVELAVDLVHVDRNAEKFLVLLEQLHPGIDVRCAVVAVNHGDDASVRSGHHVDHLVRLAEVLLKHYHREGRGTGRHVSGALPYGIGCCHSGSGVTFRRAERTARLEVTRYVETLGSVRSQAAGILSCGKALRKYVLELPRIALWSDEFVELPHHLRVVALGLRVNRNHA